MTLVGLWWRPHPPFVICACVERWFTPAALSVSHRIWFFSYFLSAGCEAVPRHSRNNRSYSHFLESDGENYESRYRRSSKKDKGEQVFCGGGERRKDKSRPRRERCAPLRSLPHLFSFHDHGRWWNLRPLYSVAASLSCLYHTLVRSSSSALVASFHLT